MSRSLPRDPPSPCTNVCRLDERSRLCLGCWRTLEEIGRWPAYSPQEKRAVLARIEQRRQQLRKD